MDFLKLLRTGQKYLDETNGKVKTQFFNER